MESPSRNRTGLAWPAAKPALGRLRLTVMARLSSRHAPRTARAEDCRWSLRRAVSRLACGSLVAAVSLTTSAPSAHAMPPQATAKPANSLIVILAGLPAGALPTAKVTGPKQSKISSTGFSRTLRKTTTLPGLAAGTYTITVQNVSFAGNTYRPSKVTGKAVVRKSGPTTYKVTYDKVAQTVGAPDPVTNLVVTPGVNKLTVRWVTPMKRAAEYSLSASPGGATCTAVKSPCDITGLSSLTAYTVTVTASNGAGKTATAVSAAVTPLRTGQTFVDGYVLGPGVNLAGAQLVGSRLTGVNLTGANLTGADLSYTNLANATLTAATLKSVKSGSISGTPAGTLPTGWILTKGYLVGPAANLSDADLSDADLSGARLVGTLLTGTNLTNADLRGVSGKDLRGVSFYGATLINAKLKDLNLSGSVLKSVRMSGADVSGADLSNAALNSASMSNANLTGANLTGADLSSATLTGATVTGATFTGAITKSMSACGLIGQPSAVSTSTAVVSGCLVAPKANLSGADFTGADLRGLNISGANLVSVVFKQANLSGVNITGSTITGADFTAATLTGLQATGLSGSPKANTLPAGWQFDAKTGSITPTSS